MPRASCDVPLDPYAVMAGQERLRPAATPPPYQAGLVDRWGRWLQKADYVVLSVERSDFIPWTPELIEWFDTHYVLVGTGPRAYVYVRLPDGLSAAQPYDGASTVGHRGVERDALAEERPRPLPS